MQEIPLDIVLNSKSLLVMLLVPSMAVGVLLILLSYKIVIKIIDDFGKPFIESQMKQASAFEQVARQSEATRITLAALSEQIEGLRQQVQEIINNGKR